MTFCPNIEAPVIRENSDGRCVQVELEERTENGIHLFKMIGKDTGKISIVSVSRKSASSL